MKEPIQHLKPANITSEVFIIAPTQVEYISRLFADNVANTMNMRTFAPKIREIAADALRDALTAARRSGAKK